MITALTARSPPQMWMRRHDEYQDASAISQ
jgi:hypothetical protein